MIKERATFVSDFWDLSSFFFQAPNRYDEKSISKIMNNDARELMSELTHVVSHVSDFTVENLKNDIKDWIGKKEVGFGKVMQPLRLALVGAMQGPDVFEIMFMIGKAETVNRVENLVQTI
jgi:glutamyl-tRNA synthetase